MVRKGDYVSIAATTAGVSGNITIPQGARLVGINLNWNLINAIVARVKVSWATSPADLIFVPTIGAQSTGVGAVTAMCDTPMIDLRGLVVPAGNTVTITLTSNTNVTVVAGLIWEE